MSKVKTVPKSVETKILELKRIEMELGHIPPEPRTLKELEKRTNDPSFKVYCQQLEAQTETLFMDICEELF
ncbi:MAG: hypothetical protein K2X39_09085, partial [Silvanigrellaceae bacterium]|nr:hypothetical protein [Silvanigrellaceae bacterium]